MLDGAGVVGHFEADFELGGGRRGSWSGEEVEGDAGVEGPAE